MLRDNIIKQIKTNISIHQFQMKIPYLIKITQIMLVIPQMQKLFFLLYKQSKKFIRKNIYHLTKTNNHSNNMKLFSNVNSQNKIINQK